MMLIAHRGNINGANESRENEPTYIEEAIVAGYDVEVDVRVINGKAYLGHDEPQYEATEWLFRQNVRPYLWIHSKDAETLEWMMKYRFHTFFHQIDDVTLTSLGWMWTMPGKKVVVGAVAVLPESVEGWNVTAAGGICSDEIARWR